MIELVKGQSISLDKEARGIKKFHVGLGWDTNKYTGSEDFDLDVSAIILDGNNKILSGDDRNFIFYNNLNSICGSIHHTGDNLTGDGDGDDEVIKLDLDKLNVNAEEVVFIVDIYDAVRKGQNFGQVSNAYVRLLEDGTQKELINYNLGEDFSIETGLLVCKVYRYNGEWKFKAIGSEYKNGLKAKLIEYGLSVR